MKFWEYVGARLTYRGTVKGVEGAQKRGWINKTTLFFLLLTVFIFIAFVLYLFGKMERGNSDNVWANIEVGDSLFVQDYGMITFYKKGKTELPGNVQRDLKYSRTDTVNFLAHNYLSDRYFFATGSSFIGICIGLDSTKTDEGNSSGNMWLTVQPANSIVEFQPSDDYSFSWKDRPDDILSTVPLSKNFFVKAADVELSNNDKSFKK